MFFKRLRFTILLCVATLHAAEKSPADFCEASTEEAFHRLTSAKWLSCTDSVCSAWTNYIDWIKAGFKMLEIECAVLKNIDIGNKQRQQELILYHENGVQLANLLELQLMRAAQFYKAQSTRLKWFCNVQEKVLDAFKEDILHQKTQLQQEKIRIDAWTPPAEFEMTQTEEPAVFDNAENWVDILKRKLGNGAASTLLSYKAAGVLLLSCCVLSPFGANALICFPKTACFWMKYGVTNGILGAAFDGYANILRSFVESKGNELFLPHCPPLKDRLSTEEQLSTPFKKEITCLEKETFVSHIPNHQYVTIYSGSHAVGSQQRAPVVTSSTGTYYKVKKVWVRGDYKAGPN